jgi:ATP-dependent DNA helicase RecG
VIADKPQGRIKVQTNIVPREKYADMLKFIETEAKKGNQTYFVCPKIDGDEEGSVMSATELYNELLERLPNLRIAILHGKIKEKEKARIMQDFRDFKYDVLVSTVVIEVGVDVPNATVMVIRNAERFGLSQLHQLRGRVGRSNKKSYCFLMSDALTDIAIERLKIIKDNDDGFKIAEKDYKLRGAGDFMGSKQSGKNITDLGHLSYDTESIFLAKKLSDECFELGENLIEIKKVALEKYEKLKDITLN